MNAPQVKAIVDVIEVRLNGAVAALDQLRTEYKGTAHSHGDLQSRFDKAMPLIQEAVQELKKWREEEAKENEAYVHLKRDVEDLKKWKDDQKKQKEETSRRIWSFGPNITAAVITFVGGIFTLILNIAVTYYILKKP